VSLLDDLAKHAEAFRNAPRMTTGDMPVVVPVREIQELADEQRSLRRRLAEAEARAGEWQAAYVAAQAEVDRLREGR
jgi:cell division septum initiation protein DivIVA